MDLNSRFVGSFCGMQGSVKRAHEGGPSGHSQTSVLAFTDEGFKSFEIHVVAAEGGFDGFPQAGNFLCR